MNLQKFEDAQFDIMHGDLLLYRRAGLIAWAGRGKHSHAAKVAWWDGQLMCMEIREFHGGRIVTLESQVRQFPERIDVYRADAQNRWPHFNRHGSVEFMRQFAGSRYGYKAMLMTALTRVPIPFAWRYFRPELDDNACGGDNPPFCSQAVAMSDRLGGGVDPVPNLADHFCEPADLARSAFYEYQFTLG